MTAETAPWDDLRVALSVVVPRAAVERYAGWPPGAPRRADLLARLDALWDPCADLVNARGCARVVTGDEARKAGVPGPAPIVGLALCTIGPGVEQEAQRLAKAGAVVDALLVGAFGSAAVEAAADALEARIVAHAPPAWGAATPRFSPGYGGWDVSHQRDLLARLPAPELGVSLTDGAMMVPCKSVSFVVGFHPGGTGAATRRGCEGCGRADCPYRRSMINVVGSQVP